MKDRLKKKPEKRKRRLIHELLDLALDINGLEPRNQELTGNLPTVFFNFSGHVGWIGIDLHLHGWRPGDRYDRKFVPCTKRVGELEQAVKHMKAIKAETPAAGTAGESK